MEACAYHEVDEAVGTCRACQQAVCAKCLEAGANGMCGMCAEVSAAQTAAPVAAAARPTPSPASAPPARPRSPTAALTGGPATGPRKANRAKATVASGMCPEHPEERAVVACEHCSRRVCGDCLNIYGLCQLCAALPTCARHESLVAEERCQACKTPYCKNCLNGSSYCPNCKDKAEAQGPSRGNKGGTAKLDPNLAKGVGTGKLPPNAKAAATGKLPPGSPAKSAGRPGGKGAKAAQAAAAKGGLPWPAIGGGIVFFALLLWLVVGGGKPQLSEADAIAALRDEMGKVQAAAMAYHKRNGEYPSNSQAILAEIEAQGVKVKELPLPLKLVVNVPPSDPWSIGYTQSGTGFEIRALDGLSRPFSVDGRDVILRPSLRAAPAPTEEGLPGGATGGQGSGTSP